MYNRHSCDKCYYEGDGPCPDHHSTIMTYIKFIALPDTWFKAGTEVLWEDSKYLTRRPTLEEYEAIKKEGAGLFVGIRVCEDNPNERNFSTPGEERLDGEWCNLDEFEVIETDEYLTPVKR